MKLTEKRCFLSIPMFHGIRHSSDISFVPAWYRSIIAANIHKVITEGEVKKYHE